MNRKQRRAVRIIAIVLACLLAGGAIISAVISLASAEELPISTRNQVSMKIEYLENEQALRITQRLVYTNTTEEYLDRLEFYAAANVFRRSSAIFYSDDVIEAAFPYGYLPGGIEINSISVNDTPADWGFCDTNETVLRVSCDLNNGEQCAFDFDYFLLLSQNSTFLGIGSTGWRLSDFYFTPLIYDTFTGEFIVQTPTSFTRYIYTPAADFDVMITIPDSCLLSATGIENVTASQNRMNMWNIHAEGVRDFSMVFGAKYKVKQENTASGITIRCFTSNSNSAKNAVRFAREAIEECEAMFGTFPLSEFDIIETDYAAGSLSMSGCLWLSNEALKSDELAHTIRYSVAQQYFGFSAYSQPGADAWLSDSISEYIAYLITDRIKGHDAYLRELNNGVVDSLQYTIPGGFVVTSNAGLLTEQEYKAIILDRGTAVFHEMSLDMGTENLISGLKEFYENGTNKDVLTEMDLVHAFDHVTGGSWEKALTDWVFNIGDYAQQSIDWLD